MGKATDRDPSGISIPFAVAKQQLEKEFGVGIVMRAADSPVLQIRRIPTAIFPLDWALAGGFPAGRVSLVWGRKSAGKTTTILKLMSQYQAMCAKCLEYDSACACAESEKLFIHWNDTEGTFDPAWAKQCGVNLEGVQLSRPAFAEQAIDIFERMAFCKEVGLMVMDSVAQLVPTKEIESSSAEHQQALGARLVNKFVRVIVGAQQSAFQEGRTLTIILVNQARSLITSYGPGGEVTPYGLQQQFGASVVLRMMYGKPIFEKERKTDLETGERIQKEYIKRPTKTTINFVVQRSKVSAPGVEGEFDLMLKPEGVLSVTDVDDFDAAFLQGQRSGYIHKEVVTDEEAEGKGETKTVWVAGPVSGRTLEEVKKKLQGDMHTGGRAMAAVKRGIIEMEYRGASATLAEEAKQNGETTDDKKRTRLRVKE